MRRLKTRGFAVIGLAAALLSGNALAALQTLTGTNVTFVYEDTEMGLFGSPTLSGDSLIFTPTNFKSQTTPSLDFGMTSDTINIKVYANSNYTLTAFNLTELGKYSLSGDGEVAVGGQLRMFDLANAPPAGPQLTDPITVTAPLTVTTPLTNWVAHAAITAPINWSNSNGVNLTIENILLAGYTQSGAAFIEKNTVILSAVPEANTYAMLLVGLGLVGFMARRPRMPV